MTHYERSPKDGLKFLANRELSTGVVTLALVACSLNLLQGQASWAQNSIEDVLALPSAPVMKGPLTPGELSGQGSLLSGNSIVFVQFVNNGKRTLSLNGDVAQVLTGKAPVAVLDQTQVIAAPSKVYVGTDVLSVLASLGTLGSGPMALDAVHKRNSNEGLYYGRDKDRRELASRRFGPRVIFPGETSKGLVYLPKSVKLPARFTIPVTSYPDGGALGNLVLDMVLYTDADLAVNGMPTADRKASEQVRKQGKCIKE